MGMLSKLFYRRPELEPTPRNESTTDTNSGVPPSPFEDTEYKAAQRAFCAARLAAISKMRDREDCVAWLPAGVYNVYLQGQFETRLRIHTDTIMTFHRTSDEP